MKRGFKVWALADSLNGYLCDFNVYTGATGERETCLGEKVVLTLSESIQGKHHQLFYDNYFFSLPLLEKLLSRDTYACGTIRTNRKNFRDQRRGIEVRQLLLEEACWSSEEAILSTTKHWHPHRRLPHIHQEAPVRVLPKCSLSVPQKGVGVGVYSVRWPAKPVPSGKRRRLQALAQTVTVFSLSHTHSHHSTHDIVLTLLTSNV